MGTNSPKYCKKRVSDLRTKGGSLGVLPLGCIAASTVGSLSRSANDDLSGHSPPICQ